LGIKTVVIRHFAEAALIVVDTCRRIC